MPNSAVEEEGRVWWSGVTVAKQHDGHLCDSGGGGGGVTISYSLSDN